MQQLLHRIDGQVGGATGPRVLFTAPPSVSSTVDFSITHTLSAPHAAEIPLAIRVEYYNSARVHHVLHATCAYQKLRFH
jgi:hypothetical protein